MSLPKIPEIKFVVTRESTNEVEEFESYRDFEDWFYEECEKDIIQAYKCADPDSRRGSEDVRDWVRNTFWNDEINEFLGEKGWELKKVVADQSNEKVRGC